MIYIIYIYINIGAKNIFCHNYHLKISRLRTLYGFITFELVDTIINSRFQIKLCIFLSQLLWQCETILRNFIWFRRPAERTENLLTVVYPLYTNFRILCPVIYIPKNWDRDRFFEKYGIGFGTEFEIWKILGKLKS